jgi:hypothetical protein
MTAVMMAAHNGHEGVLKILLEHGCDASAYDIVSKDNTDCIVDE